MAFALGAGILAANMLMHEEVGRNVIELLRDLFAERFAGDFTLRALPLVFGQFVAMLLTAEGRGKLASARRGLLGENWRGFRDGPLCCRSGLIQQRLQFREQSIGLRIELLAARAIQATQQLFELLLQTGDSALAALLSLLQFQDHCLEQRYIFGQRREIRSETNILAHAQ